VSGGLPWVVIYLVIVHLQGRVVWDGERLQASLGHWVGGWEGEGTPDGISPSIG
jgi:hypothetical protein